MKAKKNYEEYKKNNGELDKINADLNKTFVVAFIAGAKGSTAVQKFEKAYAEYNKARTEMIKVEPGKAREAYLQISKKARTEMHETSAKMNEAIVDLKKACERL